MDAPMKLLGLLTVATALTLRFLPAAYAGWFKIGKAKAVAQA